jgi:hypothetical protein
MVFVTVGEAWILVPLATVRSTNKLDLNCMLNVRQRQSGEMRLEVVC